MQLMLVMLIEVVWEVCSTGCDINVLTRIDSVTPLHRAVENGHTEAALELIRLGAEKAIVAGRFGTPLHQAVMGAYYGVRTVQVRFFSSLDAFQRNRRNAETHRMLYILPL